MPQYAQDIANQMAKLMASNPSEEGQKAEGGACPTCGQESPKPGTTPTGNTLGSKIQYPGADPVAE